LRSELLSLQRGDGGVRRSHGNAGRRVREPGGEEDGGSERTGETGSSPECPAQHRGSLACATRPFKRIYDKRVRSRTVPTAPRGPSKRADREDREGPRGGRHRPVGCHVRLGWTTPLGRRLEARWSRSGSWSCWGWSDSRTAQKPP